MLVRLTWMAAAALQPVSTALFATNIAPTFHRQRHAHALTDVAGTTATAATGIAGEAGTALPAARGDADAGGGGGIAVDGSGGGGGGSSFVPVGVFLP